ncbi:MAG: hypothetical protein V3V06_07280 [Dehalococcoidia bacterium]
MSDSQNWNRDGQPGLKQMNALTVPVGEKINHFVPAAQTEILEIVPGVSGVVVVEVEAGTFRCRVGALTPRVFTADPVTDKLTIAAGHPYRKNDGPLRVSTDTTLPAGLVADTNYWIRDVDGNDFKLSLTKGGAPVDITSAGAGVQSIGGDNGAAAAVGFNPTSPPAVTTADSGAKKFRTDELQVFDAPVTIRPITGAGDILTWWKA